MGKRFNHKQLYDQLRQACNYGFNVLLEGPADTGKTSLVQQVCADLGLKMKYYSAFTLDPFVDLVGLPTPIVREDGRRVLEFHRHDQINDAELVFFDELNRGHTKVLNAVLELIQFRTINGKLLPNLKAVFSACNPTNAEYQVTELDPALVDRFHVHLKFSNIPDHLWFEERYGRIGRALCDWWSLDLIPEQTILISPQHMAQLIEKDLEPECCQSEFSRYPPRIISFETKA